MIGYDSIHIVMSVIHVDIGWTE